MELPESDEIEPDSECTGFIIINDLVPLVVLRRLELPPGQNRVNCNEFRSPVRNKAQSIISLSDDSGSESDNSCVETSVKVVKRQ